MFGEVLDSEVVQIEVFDSTANAEATLTEGGAISVEFGEKVEVSPPRGLRGELPVIRLEKSTPSRDAPNPGTK